MRAAFQHESFPPLTATGVCRHAFINRVPGLDVQTDRQTALERLRQVHIGAREELGFNGQHFVAAEQVHGNEVALVTGGSQWAGGADGLITDRPDVCLGIYVADCAAVYLVDSVRRAIGLLHSGRKGTELNIVAAAVAKMSDAFGSWPGDLVVQISPCIRPPAYEIDFAAEIVSQCKACGIPNVHDCGSNTGSDLQRYYSYRIEQGKTGRMLALLALT